MKKNLTFLMMLMAFVGIAFAQSGPKFNYQAVVRHHVASYETPDGQTFTDIDTLYHNNPVEITVAVKVNGVKVYSETFNETTDDNGFVSVVLGKQISDIVVNPNSAYGTENSGNNYSTSPISETYQNAQYTNLVLTPTFRNINWSNNVTIEDTIKLVNTDDNAVVTHTMQVKPVPYALQAAGAILTTAIIEDYLVNTMTYQDAKDILAAFKNNSNGLQEDVEDLIESFFKSPRAKDSLKKVAKAYMAQITVEDLQDAYDVLNGRDAFKAELKNKIKAYVEDPDNTLAVARETAVDLAEWYLDTYTVSEIIADAKAVYQAMQANPQKAGIKAVIKDYLKDYVESEVFRNVIKREENMTHIVSDLTVVVEAINETDAVGAYYWLETYNPDVKALLRDTVKSYVNAYAGYNAATSQLQPTQALQGDVTTAVNKYKTHLVKRCANDTGHDYCSGN
jgi:hypothetical protein